MKRWSVLVSFCLAVVLSSVGCGGDSSSSKGPEIKSGGNPNVKPAEDQKLKPQAKPI
jgi:hypothetical protein